MPLSPDETQVISTWSAASVTGTLTFRRYGEIAFISGTLVTSAAIDGEISSAGTINKSLRPTGRGASYIVCSGFAVPKMMYIQSDGSIILYGVPTGYSVDCEGSYKI